MTYTVSALKTPVFHLGDDLAPFTIEALGKFGLRNGDIVVVTSKIVSLSEGRVVSRDSVDKQKLIAREADHDFGEVLPGCHLTIKHGLYIASAGIDESNAEDAWYILFPKDPFASCQTLHQALTAHWGLSQLAVIMTDSHVLPLRQGVSGVALAYFGCKGVQNLVGKKDLFERELRMTQVNVVDSLAAAAVFAMGEADRQCPLAIIRGAPVEFTDELNRNEMSVSPQNDLFSAAIRDQRPLTDPLFDKSL